MFLYRLHVVERLLLQKKVAMVTIITTSMRVMISQSIWLRPIIRANWENLNLFQNQIISDLLKRWLEISLETIDMVQVRLLLFQIRMAKLLRLHLSLLVLLLQDTWRMIWHLPMGIIGVEMLSQQIRLVTILKLGIEIKETSLSSNVLWMSVTSMNQNLQ